jgi:type III secretion protein N (ATPase)
MTAMRTLGAAVLGRALDSSGAPLDCGPVPDGLCGALDAPAALPSLRRPVERPMWTGVRAIDALLTIGRGARVGIFGAPGCGKSTLLETIVAGVRADAVVVGLVGERGREAQRWIDVCDARTSVICATSDRPAQERIDAAWFAMSHACALASRGLHVLLLLDSLARIAYALREAGVTSGESVGRGGYPPSVFSRVAQLVERAGAFACGSVTMLATVLTDGDDRDPVSESARALLDGHIQLSSGRAQAGRFPAIDVPASASRTMAQVVTGEHAQAAALVRGALAALQRSEDARALGLEPADCLTRSAVAAERQLEGLLRQGIGPIDPRATLEALAQTADMFGEGYGYHG